MANLCFLNVWNVLIQPAPEDCYRKVPNTVSLLPTTMANVALVAAVVFAGIRLARRLNPRVRPVAEFLFLGFFLIPLNVFRIQFPALSLGNYRFAIPAFAIAAVLAWAAIQWRRRFIGAVCRLLLILLPLVPMFIVGATVQRARAKAGVAAASVHPGVRLATPDQPRRLRAVWVIFDELDQCLAFSGRPADLRLAEFDRLRDESIFAAGALPPGDNTTVSMPSLLTGRIVQSSRIPGPEDLQIRYRGERGYRSWRSEPNVFRKAQGLHFNVGVVGWYLPYCPFFELGACQWEPVESVFLSEEYVRYLSFPGAMAFGLARQWSTVPGLHKIAGMVGWSSERRVPEARTASRKQAMVEYRRVHEGAMQLLGDQRFDLVFLHWPVPHPPYYFDRRTGEFSTRDGLTYFDALAHADGTLGDIRAALERAGLWDETALLVSSDHPLRDPRGAERQILAGGRCSTVPFFLKMPGRRQAVRYDQPLNTVVSGDLLLAILKREVGSAEEAAGWLKRHRE